MYLRLLMQCSRSYSGLADASFGILKVKPFVVNHFNPNLQTFKTHASSGIKMLLGSAYIPWRIFVKKGIVAWIVAKHVVVSKKVLSKSLDKLLLSIFKVVCMRVCS